MNAMTEYEIVKMAREAGFSQDWQFAVPPATLSNFATICRAPLVAEVERLQETVRTYDKRIVALGCIAMEDVHRPSFGVKNCAEIARAERDDWKARALKAEQAGDRAVPDAEDYDLIDRYLRNNLDDADYGEYLAALDRLVTPQPAAQEPTSAVPVVEQLLSALMYHRDQTRPINTTTEAIAAGQKFIKENGK